MHACTAGAQADECGRFFSAVRFRLSTFRVGSARSYVEVYTLRYKYRTHMRIYISTETQNSPPAWPWQQKPSVKSKSQIDTPHARKKKKSRQVAFFSSPTNAPQNTRRCTTQGGFYFFNHEFFFQVVRYHISTKKKIKLVIRHPPRTITIAALCRKKRKLRRSTPFHSIHLINPGH